MFLHMLRCRHRSLPFRKKRKLSTTITVTTTRPCPCPTLTSNNINIRNRNNAKKKKKRKKCSSSTIQPHPPQPSSRFNPLQFQSENETENDEGDDVEDMNLNLEFKLKRSARSSGHSVQPLGNLLLSSNPNKKNCRNPGLGALAALPDDLLLDIFSLLGPTHLVRLSTLSKALYVFSSHDPLWRPLVLRRLPRPLSFSGSWRSTFLRSSSPNPRLRVRDFFSDYLFQSWLCASIDVQPHWLHRDNIPRRTRPSLSEFVADFEEPNHPVLLRGCLDDWLALRNWDLDYLLRVCGDNTFSVGPVEMTLADFFQYSHLANEERPLYLFDPRFAKKVPQLGSDYNVPEYFKEDLFAVLGAERPDYQWVIMGPAGSGSSFHVDPNSTSAWNAVIKGSKKWVMFPPDVVPPGVHPSPDGAEVACPVSIMEWFMNFYEATKKWKRRPVECVCRAGEVVFVPNGWWHLVINLEDSIAITQNYVSRRNLLNVLDFLKRPNANELVSGTRDRVNLHDKFRSAIETSYPGMFCELTVKAEEKKAQQKKPTFWESVTDSRVGGFKFNF